WSVGLSVSGWFPGPNVALLSSGACGPALEMISVSRFWPTKVETLATSRTAIPISDTFQFVSVIGISPKFRTRFQLGDRAGRQDECDPEAKWHSPRRHPVRPRQSALGG